MTYDPLRSSELRDSARPRLFGGRILSGWWRRVAASLLDYLVALPLGVLVLWLAGFDFDRWLDSPEDSGWAL